MVIAGRQMPGIECERGSAEAMRVAQGILTRFQAKFRWVNGRIRAFRYLLATERIAAVASVHFPAVRSDRYQTKR
jgi:hypothetical protein